MIADDDPRLAIPGEPNSDRYLCPLRVGDSPCSWYLDVPRPEVEPLERVGDSYVLTVAEVPMAAIEARILAHLRAAHVPAEVWARFRELARDDAPPV